jgi:uncharacterized membrane protein YfcA
MEWLLAYLGIGVVVGFLAGLLGIGGGAVTVPLLVWAFGAQALPAEHVIRMALGTSMAAIFFTSLSSMRAHQQHGAVDWKIVRAMAPGILAGSFGAALAAAHIPTRGLAMIFTVLAFYAAAQMLFELRPPPSRTLPGTAGIFAAGTGIGAASSLFAAGGAFLTVPFLVWCNVPIRRAIGTAAGNGFPIAWRRSWTTSLSRVNWRRSHAASRTEPNACRVSGICALQVDRRSRSSARW